jgi:hypothetical protein
MDKVTKVTTPATTPATTRTGQTAQQAIAALDAHMKTPAIDVNYTAKKGRQYSGETITLLKTAGAIPAQAGKIIEALAKAKDHTLTVVQLVGTDLAGKDSALDAVGLVTVQTPTKIWQFYRKTLVDKGMISVS